ncbi:hypothetical protein [Bifidobacterium psychraerophilum]|uniref:hypothetical protein n=1 Tax=Bifidobacterium psychraerophilum TaxID=218140 RepID=UPI0039E78BE9
MDPLAKYSKIVPTYKNVIAGIKTAEGITQQLANLLNAQQASSMYWQMKNLWGVGRVGI